MCGEARARRAPASPGTAHGRDRRNRQPPPRPIPLPRPASLRPCAGPIPRIRLPEALLHQAPPSRKSGDRPSDGGAAASRREEDRLNTGREPSAAPRGLAPPRSRARRMDGAAAGLPFRRRSAPRPASPRPRYSPFEIDALASACRAADPRPPSERPFGPCSGRWGEGARRWAARLKRPSPRGLKPANPGPVSGAPAGAQAMAPRPDPVGRVVASMRCANRARPQAVAPGRVPLADAQARLSQP